MLEYVYDFFYRLLTFEFDVTGTISSVLLLMTLYRTLAGFFSFLRDSGPLSTLVAAATTVIVGPLPTLLRFVALPLLRVEAFLRGELLPFFNAADDDEANDVEIEGGLERNARMAEAEAAVLAQIEADGAAAEGEGVAAASTEAEAGVEAEAAAEGAEAEEPPEGMTAEMRAARRKLPQKGGEAPKRGLRQRAKAAVTQGGAVRQPTKAELHARFALRRMGEAMEEAFLTPVALQPMRTLLARRADPNARAYAAGVVQFELLLSTSKPLIPLCCLLATGQVFNGIFFSIATAQVLHRLPGLRAETQHLLVLLVGALHTLVCAGKSQLMELEKAPEGLLQLQWTWGMRDVFAIANMLLIGASFSTAAATFNEPPFCASFAAGLALRIAIYEATPSALPTTRHPPPATLHPPPSTRHPPHATLHTPPSTRHPPPRHPPHATLRHATLHCAVLYRATPPRHRRTPASPPQGSQPAVSPSLPHHRRRHPRAPSPLRRSAPPLWARGCASSCAARTSSTSASTRSPPPPHFRPRPHPASTPRTRPPPPPRPHQSLRSSASRSPRVRLGGSAAAVAGRCARRSVAGAPSGCCAQRRWPARRRCSCCRCSPPRSGGCVPPGRGRGCGARGLARRAPTAPLASLSHRPRPPSRRHMHVPMHGTQWCMHGMCMHVPCSAHRGRRRVASR